MIDLFNYQATADKAERDALFVACVRVLLAIQQTPATDRQRQSVNLRDAALLAAQLN